MSGWPSVLAVAGPYGIATEVGVGIGRINPDKAESAEMSMEPWSDNRASHIEALGFRGRSMWTELNCSCVRR